jgi:hypothetical protein
MHQFKNGLLPSLLNGTWILNSERRQQLEEEETRIYEMRNFDDFFIHFSRLTTSDRLPFISFPKMWNNFSNHKIKLITNKKDFNKKLKTHVLCTLNESIVCARLTCQACHPFTI